LRFVEWYVVQRRECFTFHQVQKPCQVAIASSLNYDTPVGGIPLRPWTLPGRLARGRRLVIIPQERGDRRVAVGSGGTSGTFPRASSARPENTERGVCGTISWHPFNLSRRRACRELARFLHGCPEQAPAKRPTSPPATSCKNTSPSSRAALRSSSRRSS